MGNSLTDKDDFDNYIPDHWWHSSPDLVYVPAGSRTTAALEKGASYIYWSSGGLSWTMPYVLGLYAIVTEIDPSLTKTDLEQLIVRTAYLKGNMRIVNPVEFVAAAQQLYTILQADNIQRGGQVMGIQIFGDPTLVPAFEVGYKTQSINYQGTELVDDAGSMLTDLFYGNFNNLTTAALRGNCVGMFSTTHIISNNGVDCAADLEEMTQSNFYYFYLHYLNALSHGASRSDAFFEGQRAYGNALIVASQNGLQGEGNYQFNLCNLLGYHNFGLIEPTRAYGALKATIS